MIDGALRDILVCHCRDCVEAAGHPWAATAVHRRDLVVRESEGLRWRKAPLSDHGASRGVCYRCGSVVFWDAPARETVSLGVETLDTTPPLVVGGHIWLDHDPDWEPDEAEADLRLPTFPRGVSGGLRGPVLRWVD